MSSLQAQQGNSTQEASHQDTQSLNILTLFPDAVTPYFNIGVTGRAIDRKVIDLHCVNFRDYAEGNYKAVDDLPFGGGAGMVIQAEPVARALDDLVVEPLLDDLHGAGAHRLLADHTQQVAVDEAAEITRRVKIIGASEHEVVGVGANTMHERGGDVRVA